MTKRNDHLAGAIFGNGALRRQMLRDLDQISRRELFKRTGRVAGGAAAAAALLNMGLPIIGSAQDATPAAEAPALPEYTGIPENLKGTGEVRVQSWGGAFQEAQRQAYFKPFEELSGIKVIEGEGPDLSKVKASVDIQNPEYDVVQMDRSDIILLEKDGDYWEPIDYSIFDVDNIAESKRYKYSVDMLPYGWVIGYRTDAFGDKELTGQADMWNVAEFPGGRSTTGATGGVSPFLEAALIADGVSKDALYPIDIERAFASLSKIKGDVVKFWEAGAEPAQLLTDNEVTVAHSWNGRLAAIQKEGAPVKTVWNEAMLATDVWAAPKGAANLENAFKFMAFITLPESQARLASLIPYGFVNDKAAEFLTADQLANLPTAPDYKAIMFDRDVAWWVENRDAVQEYWNEWILE